MGCGVALASDCNTTWCVSKVLGQSDHSDVGEMLRDGVDQRRCTLKGVSERHVMHRAAVCGLAQVRRGVLDARVMLSLGRRDGLWSEVCKLLQCHLVRVQRSGHQDRQ